METNNKPRRWRTPPSPWRPGCTSPGVSTVLRVDTDASESFGGTDAGPQPLRFLLLGVAGCTAMDVISILRKKRQRVSGF
jgi:uncharacterized OsmC-like protein